MGRSPIIFVIGAPGAGKGAACKRLTNQTGTLHLSVDDYLRYLRDTEENLPAEAFGGLSQEQIRSKLKARQLIAPEQITAIIRHKIGQYSDQFNQTILIDGFPRSHDSADVFEREVGNPSMVVLFDCPCETAALRFLGRERENDDDETTFDKRFSEFESNNQMIMDRYAQVVKYVDTSGSIEDCYKQFKHCLKTVVTALPNEQGSGRELHGSKLITH